MYQHKEAYCWMIYETDDKLEKEVLWNSRDGVTPFVITNRSGNKKMTHTDWHRDTVDRYAIPRIGTRIFVDLTQEKLLEYKRSYVEKYWNHPSMPMQSHPTFDGMSKEEAAQHLAESEWKEGMPDVVTVDEALNTAFAKAFTIANTSIDTKEVRS